MRFFLPCLPKDIDLSTVFPVLCHGDDADSHRRRSFTVLTIGSPLTRGRSSWDERFLIYVMDVNRSVPETYDCLDAWVVYSLTELQEGRFMNVGAYGQPYERSLSGPICGPYRGVLFALKVDQKYLQRALKLTTSWVSDKCCMYCDARTSGPNIYTFFGEHAPHRATLKTTNDFIVNGSRPNHWVRCPGFDISMVFTDWLHLVDLALTPEIAASVSCLWLSLLCFVGFCSFPGFFDFTMFYLLYLELVVVCPAFPS
jgi:hypothetical protein